MRAFRKVLAVLFLMAGIVVCGVFAAERAGVPLGHIDRVLDTPAGHVASLACAAIAGVAIGGIALVPGESFEAPGFCRLSYAVSEADIESGMDTLQAFVGRLRPALERAV